MLLVLVKCLFLLLSNCLSGRIPVRLYVWSVSEDFDDLEDAPDIDCWDKISFINRPVEVHTEEGKPCYLLYLMIPNRICGVMMHSVLHFVYFALFVSMLIDPYYGGPQGFEKVI